MHSDGRNLLDSPKVQVSNTTQGWIRFQPIIQKNLSLRSKPTLQTVNILLELTLFSVAVVGVVAFGIWKARDEINAEDAGASGYFLAGRGLFWWLVGFSLASRKTQQLLF